MSQTGIFFRYYICRRFLALYMKNKIFMKVLALCVCLTIFCSTPATSYALEASNGSISPRFTYISYYSSFPALVASSYMSVTFFSARLTSRLLLMRASMILLMNMMAESTVFRMERNMRLIGFGLQDSHLTL